MGTGSSMNKIIETLDRHGLTTLDSAWATLERMPLRKIVALASEITDAIIHEDSRFHTGTASWADPFSFLASASVRADAGCVALDCRERRLTFLARYSALYCDYVAVPFGFHLYPELGVARAREDFLERLVTIIELRPVIEAQVVRLFLQTRCNHCMQMLPAGEAVAKIAKRLAAEHFKRFTATYLPHRSKPGFRIEGPIEYVEHGALVQTYDELPERLPNSLRCLNEDAEAARLSIRALRNSHLIEDIFETIAVDVIHQQIEGALRPLNYLMGRRGEAEFLSKLSPDHELERRTAALCAHLTHAIPRLMDVPLSSVLAIRQREHQSFLDYRNTIRSIISEHLQRGGEVSNADARQIYLDVLRPRLDKLKSETENERRRNRRNAVISVGVPAALLSIGIVGGVLPPEIAGLLKISGTVGLVNEGLKGFLAAVTTPTSTRNNSLYFLLELDAASSV
jgi:hypothetical protein